MDEEGDVPSVSEVVQSTPMESLNDELTPKISHLISNVNGSLTGMTKSQAKVTVEWTEEIGALQLKVSQLTKELEESREETDRYKRELEDETANSKRELDSLNEKLEASRVEVDQYKREFGAKTSLFSQLEKDKLLSQEIDNLKIAHLKIEAGRDSLITKLECEVKMKSAEIEHLKTAHLKIEALSKSLISQLEREMMSKSAEVEHLKIAPLKAEALSKSQISQLEGELKSKSAEIEDLKMERDESTATFKDVLTLKNAKIRQLEVELAKALAVNSTNKLVAQNQMISEDVQNGFDNVKENLIRLLNKPAELTIRARFVVSELTDERTYSQVTEHAGMNWSVYVFKKDDHLAFYVDGQGINEKWCSAFANYQLISQKNEEIVHSLKTETIDEYSENFSSWGYEHFIPFEDVFDEENGFVMNDTIIVAVVIKAFPAN